MARSAREHGALPGARTRQLSVWDRPMTKLTMPATASR
jgi:hypothetical protein